MADPTRTEPATQRHREDVRKKGQVARSSEITAILVLFAALLFFKYQGLVVYQKLTVQMTSLLGEIGRGHFSNNQMMLLLSSVTLDLLIMLFPFFLVILIAALLANILQVGFFVTPTPLVPKWERLNAVKGFQKIFSKKALAELIKAFVKIALVLTIVFYWGKQESEELMRVMNLSGEAYVVFFAGIIMKLVFRILIALLVIAILDYMYQRWDFEESIRMTRQEVRDEIKQTEGDPLIRSRIRSLQREMARRRMMLDLPTADVVITNPTHLAVALVYKENEMSAPKVIAKGARLVAQRIRETAFEHNIPVIENKPLARALFDQAEVGQEIPATLFQTVAGIIAFIYRLKQGRKESAQDLEGGSRLIAPGLGPVPPFFEPEEA